MPRRMRIQYPGARYHVINRGNFRQPVFASAGAAQAFERALAEATRRYRWRVHAYMVLSNHFHVALETPDPNLTDGMHWLLTTFCSRHNRFRQRHGHLFQGRYKALLVENETYLDRVIDYIHLNPLRARLLPPRRLGEYRPSSLWWLLQAQPPDWLQAGAERPKPPATETLARLIALAEEEQDDDRLRPGAYSSGWAIGTSGWKRALAKERAQAKLCAGLERDEIQEWKEDLWARELEAGLAELGKTSEDAERDAKSAGWKIALARQLRARANAPHRWLAQRLHMGAESSVRAYLSGSD